MSDFPPPPPPPPAAPPPAGEPSRPQSFGAALRMIVLSPLGGAMFALAAVLLVIAAVLALGGDDGDRRPSFISTDSADATRTESPRPPPSSPPSPSPSGSDSDSDSPTTTTPPSPPPSSGATPSPSAPAPPQPPPTTAPPNSVRGTVAVLNNSRINGLASDVADQFRAGGWTVSLVGNFTGRIPTTTVYYTPGNAAEERAAHALAEQFSQIRRVLPRYEGLPPNATGVVVVVTRDWVS